jgi:hypothetical protein
MSFARKTRRGAGAPPRPPAGDTKTTLVADLQQKTETPERNVIIELATAGHYHDFDSDLPAPKMQLVADLIEAGYEDLAENVKRGAYDNEAPTLAQREQMRDEVGPELYDALFREPRGRA